MTRSLTVLILAPLLGCGRTAGPSQPATPPPVTGSVSWQAASARYRAVSRVRIEQQLEGRTQRNDLDLVYYATVTLVPDTADQLRASLVIDSLMPDSAGTITAADRGRIAGARFEAVILKDGRVANQAGPDSILPTRLRQLPSGFWQNFPRVPAAGLGPGAQFTDSSESKVRSADADVTVKAVNSRRALDWVTVGARRAVAVTVESSYTISGSGQQFGQPFSLEGKGSRQIHQHVSSDGRFLGGDMADTATVQVVLTQMGITIPGRQTRVDTLSLIP